MTIVYQGELEHRDSTGSGGTIGPGDVQWMTAASGILHEEFHSEAFSRTGGTLEMVQLWVNLPARDKLAPPAYQTLLATDIPQIELANAAGSLRLIAGQFAGQRGPAHTFTAMDVWDIHLRAGKFLTLPVVAGRNTALVVLRGSLRINGEQALSQSQLALFEPAGDELHLEANGDTTLLLLSGEPIDEPVVGHGPFVMNSEAQIQQAILDFQTGEFGRMHD
ncbi:Quercetin 2,3-dioxygenase [compost metagenome]